MGFSICVELKASVKVKGSLQVKASVKVKESVRVKGSVKVKGSVGPRKSIGVRLKETDLKKHGHTRCDLCVEVEGSLELKSSIEVK